MNVASSVIATPAAVDQQRVNTLRCLVVDAVQKANRGHPRLPLGHDRFVL